jgi:HlyD family secretion protein
MNTSTPAIQDINQEQLNDIAITIFSERSEMAQELISRKPDFYERWALLSFLVLLLLLIAGTWFFKYPDIIQASAVLTSSNAPKEILPKKSGILTALFVKNNQLVQQGEILGWIESNADVKEVVKLAARLDSGVNNLGKSRPEGIVNLLNSRFVNLGELQSGYQVFIAALQQYNDYLVNGFYAKRKQLLNGDIASLEMIRDMITRKKDFNTKDNELAKESFDMNETLYGQKIISAEEYRQAQSALINKKKTDPEMEMNIMTQQNQIRDKQKEIDQLNHDMIQQHQTFEQALHTLKSSVDDWLRQYTLQAPAAGRIVFALPLQENQFVQQGKLIGYVNPENSKYYAEIKLAQNNFGKVDTGMKVQLRFDAYPYQETGFVRGTLSYISNLSVDSAFLGAVRLDSGLYTSQNRTIPYKNGLKARALIITKDRRLFERLYYSIVKTTSLNK